MRSVRLESLEPRTRQAIQAARDALDASYSPYSRFRVACCILLADGGSITGVNVENASFGLSMCAERTAVFQAVAEGHREFQELIVVSETEEPATPCGACRQVLSEFAEELRILLVGTRTIRECMLGELLPHAFRDWREGDSS